MIKLLLLLGFLCDFLPEGNPLSCIHCDTLSGTDCNGVPRECNEHEASCIEIMELSAMGNQTVTAFRRSCNDEPDICNSRFRMVGGIQDTFITTECCHAENCNKYQSKVPERNNTVNGYLCPVCHSLNSYECKAKGYILCRGQQTECVDMAVTLKKIDSSTLKFSLMGCITPSGCALGPKILPAAKFDEAVRLSCSPAMKLVQ